MTPDAFLELWPAWLAVSISALLAFNRLIEESRKFAAFFGEWGRQRHEKAIKRHQVDLQASLFADAVQAAVAKAREQWEDEENEAIAALRVRLEEVARITGAQALDLANLRVELDKMSQYAEYEVEWHKRMRALASQDGPIPAADVPAHMNWWAFERLYDKLGPTKDWWFAANRDEQLERTSSIDGKARRNRGV